MKIETEAIGTVHSCFKEKFGTPRQGRLVADSQGYIEIARKWEPDKCLNGLKDFSHIWVLFWFHDNKNQGYRPVISPPRQPKRRIGALASRSPLRPNPIGLSLVKLERIEGARVYISGLDIIEGTPVLDIKPFIQSYDSVSDSSDGWLSEIETQPLTVKFSDLALEQISAQTFPNLKQAICDILTADVRNRSDKRQNHGKRLGFYFDDLNVVFRVDSNEVEVLYIEPRL